jgi:hypothetical protein
MLFSLMLSGGLVSASAIAQPMNPSQQEPQVQHLVNDLVNERLEVSSGEQAAATTSDISERSAWFTTEQLGQASNLLIGFMFLGLPISLVFAVSLHDKRDAKRTQLVEWLERIWNQSPQA